MRRPLLRAIVLLSIASLTAGWTFTAASSAAAATLGYVRLAHLSPDTPKVDVWLTSFRGNSYSEVFRGVGYGVVSPYQRVAVGTYTVSMRPPGADESTQPLLSSNVRVQGGRAYTVAGVGRNADITLRVLKDDLSPPADSGNGRLRVVQASSVAPVVDVATTTGESIATAAEFPSTTAYAEVPAQRWTLIATPTTGGTPPARTTVNVAAGSIYTVLVLDSGDDGLQMRVQVDAAGSGTMPVGAVTAGLGGMARQPAHVPWELVALVGALLAAAGAVIVRPAVRR